MISSQTMKVNGDWIKPKLTADTIDELLIVDAYKTSKKNSKLALLKANFADNSMDDYESLVYFCLNGVKPPWLSNAPNFSPAELLYRLYIDNYGLFVEFIQSIRGDDKMMIRVVELIDRISFFYNYNNLAVNDKFLNQFNCLISNNNFKDMVKCWLINLKT